MPPPKDPIKYEEYRRKLSEAGKKRYEDPEIRLKQSEAWKGEKNPNFGKSPSEETRRRLREAVKLRVPASEETRRKLSEAGKRRYEDPEVGLKQGEAQRGEKNPNFGKKMSDEQRQKISESRKKRFEDPIKGEETRKKISEAAKKRFEDPIRGEVIRRKISGTLKKRFEDPIKGEEIRKKMSEVSRLRAPASEETCRKHSEAQKGRHHSSETRRKMSEGQMGEKGNNWMGGISFLPYCQKFNNEFKERVRAFFNHQCVECGTPQKEKKLGVHHVNFDKQSCCNDTVPLFVPLCRSCHTKTNHNREYWEQHFTEMINNYYGGKCYYLKEEMTAIKRAKHQ